MPHTLNTTINESEVTDASHYNHSPLRAADFKEN